MNSSQNEKLSEAIILSGIAHIRAAQRPDGSFSSLSSHDPENFSDAINHSTTFFTSSILSCLNATNRSGKISIEAEMSINCIRQNAARFLLAEKGERWSWNYWSKHAPEQTTMPYPDDIDDTFTALSALCDYNEDIVNGSALAAIANMLVAVEEKEGGPYRTWLVAGDSSLKWDDIDLVANSAVSRFLASQNVVLPNVENLLAEAVRENRLASPYYPGFFQVAYFVSRCWCQKENEALGDLIAAREGQHRANMTPLERAMMISSLAAIELSERIPSDAVQSLAEAIGRNGWRPHAFCVDPSRENTVFYAGASALTAAYCVEALALTLQQHRRIGASSYTAASRSNVHIHIQNLARIACSGENTELATQARQIIEKTNDSRITCLAYEFRDILRRRGILIRENLAQELSLGNLYGWMAYEIYDDIQDGEGEPALIPCANFFLRKLADVYAMLEKSVPGAWNLFQRTLDRVDGANAWEHAHERISLDENGYFSKVISPEDSLDKNLANLANRSIGHALGPKAQLLAAGFHLHSKEQTAIDALFRHYLIARQLHDDAHDWADDLSRGRLSNVGIRVIRRFEKISATTQKPVPSAALAEIMPTLKHIFWTEIMAEVAGEIQDHLAAARKARESSDIMKGSGFMEKDLERLSDGANRALREQRKMVEFLQSYPIATSANDTRAV